MFIDVVCKYCFGYCNDLLSEPGFHPDTIVNLEEGLKMGPLLKHNYWMMSLLEALPEVLSAWIAPAYGGFVREKKVGILYFLNLAGHLLTAYRNLALKPKRLWNLRENLLWKLNIAQYFTRY